MMCSEFRLREREPGRGERDCYLGNHPCEDSDRQSPGEHGRIPREQHVNLVGGKAVEAQPSERTPRRSQEALRGLESTCLMERRHVVHASILQSIGLLLNTTS